MRAIVRAGAGRAAARLAGILLPLLTILGGASIAQDQPKGGPTPSPPGAEVYFIGLEDGATVPTKFSVNFGLERMGVAPAGSDRANSGHHHLLIDTDLPPLDQPIPNDFNHLHFGAGQTEASVTLRPGEHTLQLLLADKDHIPHSPPVMSARIKVRVVSDMPPAPPPPTARSRTPSPPGAEVYFVGLRDGASVQRRVRIRFGLRNMGVAPAGSDRENSGHHHLLIDTDLPPLDQPIPNDFNHLHFGNGETETTVTLSPGEHTLQLLLADGDHVPHDPPVTSARIRVRVDDGVAATSEAAPNPAPAPGPAHTHAHVAEPAPASPQAPPSQPPPPNPAQSQPGISSPTTPADPDPAQAATALPARSLTPSASGAEAYFVDLEDGATVSSEVSLRFGVRNMGIAPAGFPVSNSGHYHLLIDAPMPPLDQPIPADANHLHFDKGQMQTVLTLTPGQHTLQLLLGDKDHVPHAPPVVSKRITIHVGETRNRTPSPRGAAAFIIGRRNGDRLSTTVKLYFGVDHMKIAPAGASTRNSGHYHLLIDRKLPPLDKPIPEDSNHLDFSNGQTEATITLTPGEHTLQLLLGDANHMPHDPPVTSAPLTVIVAEPRNRDNRERDEPARRNSSQRTPRYDSPRSDERSSRNGSNRPRSGHNRRYNPDRQYDRYSPYPYSRYGNGRYWRDYYPD